MKPYGIFKTTLSVRYEFLETSLQGGGDGFGDFSCSVPGPVAGEIYL